MITARMSVGLVITVRMSVGLVFTPCDHSSAHLEFIDEC